LREKGLEKPSVLLDVNGIVVIADNAHIMKAIEGYAFQKAIWLWKAIWLLKALALKAVARAL